MKLVPWLARIAQGIVLVTVLALAAHVLFQPDPLDDRRRADIFFAHGQYHAALRSYQKLEAGSPSGPTALRLGILHALRGEHRLSEDRLRQALRRGLRSHDHDLANLYLGLQHAKQGRPRYAANAWAQVTSAAALYPLRLILEAEQALRLEDYALAEVDLRASLALRLPPTWQAFASYRLSLLVAARDPAGATALLTQLQPVPADPLLVPLLPLAPSKVEHAVAQLRTVLQATQPERSQMLGQLYLDARLYALADAQFAQVPDTSATARAAAAYAAYSRWVAGDRDGGMTRLKALVARYPDDARARSLLAVAYLQLQRNVEAAGQLEAINLAAPRDPATNLAWGQWYVVQGDYPRAAAQYRRAVEQAPAAEQAGYALTAAEFYLSNGYGVCAEGRDLAATAVKLRPDLLRTWTTQAALSYYCRDAAAARDAALKALALDPQSAVASYYLGMALKTLGSNDDARIALTRAADLDPAGIWRQRAEAQLQQ